MIPSLAQVMGGVIREIPYRSTGLSWTLDHYGDQGVAEAMFEAGPAEIAETGFDGVRQARLVVHYAPDEREELENRLDQLLDEFRTRQQRPGVPGTAIYLATNPSG
jgi:hypothetical protein